MEFELADLLIPAGLVVGGLLLGFLVEKLVLNTLGERLSGTRLNWGGRVVGAFSGVVTLWFGVAGAYLALARLPLEPAVAGLLRNILLAALMLSGTLVAARIAGGLVGAYTSTVARSPRTSPPRDSVADLRGRRSWSLGRGYLLTFSISSTNATRQACVKSSTWIR